MTSATFIEFLVLIGLSLLGSYTIYRQNDLIKFERKAKRVIVAFSKAVYYTALEKFQKTPQEDKVDVILPVVTEEDYKEMLEIIDSKNNNKEIIAA